MATIWTRKGQEGSKSDGTVDAYDYWQLTFVHGLPPLKKHPVSEGGREKLDGKRGKLALGFGSTESYLGAEETI